MIPNLDAQQLAHIKSNLAGAGLLVELDISDTETMYLCTGLRDLEYNGHTYLGVGLVANIEPITEKVSMEAIGLRMSLSGVPLAMRSLALQTPLRGRECRVFVALFDANEQPIGVVTKEFSGKMSAPAIETTGTGKEDALRTATITIEVESAFINWAKGGRGRRHTHEDQQFYYPGDMGYEYADAVSNETHLWGVPY